MNNEWLKEKVKAELEVEYKQKLDEVVKHYEKKIEEACEEAWNIIQEVQRQLQEERDKNKNMEVKLYQEYEQQCKIYKDCLIDSVDRYMASPAYKHGLTASQIVEEAVKA